MFLVQFVEQLVGLCYFILFSGASEEISSILECF